MPARVTREIVLIDPMTEEEISKTLAYITQEDIQKNPAYTERDLGRVKQTPFGEPQYIIRDYWFRIQAKFAWKDAPALPQPSSSSYGPAAPYGGGGGMPLPFGE